MWNNPQKYVELKKHSIKVYSFLFFFKNGIVFLKYLFFKVYVFFFKAWTKQYVLFAYICIKYFWKGIEETNNTGCLSGKELVIWKENVLLLVPYISFDFQPPCVDSTYFIQE